MQQSRNLYDENHTEIITFFKRKLKLAATISSCDTTSQRGGSILIKNCIEQGYMLCSFNHLFIYKLKWDFLSITIIYKVKQKLMTIELAQQRSRLLRRLPRQTPRNDKRGGHCEQSEAIS